VQFDFGDQAFDGTIVGIVKVSATTARSIRGPGSVPVVRSGAVGADGSRGRVCVACHERLSISRFSTR
jgi:hypothetical protein